MAYKSLERGMKEFSLIVSIVAWLASKGLDRFVAKWVAYFQIAWENSASAEAKAFFDAATHRVKVNMPDKAAAWESWRRNSMRSDGPTL